MPIYEYRCGECEHTFEKFHSMNESNKPLKNPCPECGKKSVNKTFATGGGGVDLHKGPGSDYKELMKKMKSGIPERYHGRLDQSADRTAGRIGPQ
tara:strand:+ start:382 stop:666 length:285 start_codon:yes stop_codon:yes gene_type:complete